MSLGNVIRGLEEYDDGVVFNSSNQIYSIFFSKNPWKDNEINIWFEFFGRDLNSQFYDLTLHSYEELTEELLERTIPYLLKTYMQQYIDKLEQEIELL